MGFWRPLGSGARGLGPRRPPLKPALPLQLTAVLLLNNVLIVLIGWCRARVILLVKAILVLLALAPSARL